MTETKKSLWIGLACVLAVAVLLSAGASVFAAKGVYELRAEAAKEEETREDDVSIMSQYTIRSTLPISDAYLSGNTNGLVGWMRSRRRPWTWPKLCWTRSLLRT